MRVPIKPEWAFPLKKPVPEAELMSRNREVNGKQSKLNCQQLQFPHIDSEFERGNNGLPAQQKPRSQRRVYDGEKRPSDADTLAIVEVIQLEFARVEGRIAAIEALLKQIAAGDSTGAATKEFYSTKEAADYLDKKPYTVREWCRNGRINSYKAPSGRGLDEEWRISRDELVRYQNEGLLPIKPDGMIGPPKRLGY